MVNPAGDIGQLRDDTDGRGHPDDYIVGLVLADLVGGWSMP